MYTHLDEDGILLEEQKVCKNQEELVINFS